MFFRRVFSKNNNDYTKEIFEEASSDQQSSPSPPMKMQKRRASIGEKQSRGLSVLQLTPLWEHIIRTNSMPRSIILSDVFDEFFERLHDPEPEVRQHALRVLVDVLIVMGQQADYHIQNLVHPLVDNLGHVAPAVRKGALDALRVYIAQTAMPETVMLDIMNYGMERPMKDPYGGRLTVAMMLALPALILPILITPKRQYVAKAVLDAMTNKMSQITYQEIALKILLKIKEMIGANEFYEFMPSNVKQDFELLCKVYGLPKSPGFHDPLIDIHVPAHDPKKPWASKFVPKKDSQGNDPSAHAPISQDGSKYFGNNYDATYPFERTRLSNNLGTPKRMKSPRVGSGGIVRSSSVNSLSADFNGNSSGSESGGSSMSSRTQNNTAVNSKPFAKENGSRTGSATCDRALDNGKVIMETEIKINPETAVTMRILEQNPSTQTDDSDEETGGKRIITDFSAPYPVTPMRVKNPEDSNNLKVFNESALPRNGRRVRFGGEIVKMRTPDSDAIDQSDDNEATILNLPPHRKNQSSNNSDNSSVSSENSNTYEYIKQTNIGFNVSQLKDKKFDDVNRKSFGSKLDSSELSKSMPVGARPASARAIASPSNVFYSRPLSTARSTFAHLPSVKHSEEKTSSSSSSTDYSQELRIGIPEFEVPPHSFTPPSIMIKKTTTNFSQNRPSTSPMLSPQIITIPPTSSSSHSSKNTSPNKSAPTTPTMNSPSKRMKSMSPERTPIRRSVSSLSPRMFNHHGVTMLHNLQRSPISSPAKARRASVSSSVDGQDITTTEDATQTPTRHSFHDVQTYEDIKTPQMTERTQSGFNNNSKTIEKSGAVSSSLESTSSKESPEFKSWEELGIVDFYVLKDLKSGVSFTFHPA